MDKVKDSVWIFFMIIFSRTCHQKASRSFFLCNYQFPICARCTGLLLGYCLGIIIVLFKVKISLTLSTIFATIMFVDWFIQYKGIRVSNNYRRLFTGSLCGIGIIGVLSNIYAFVCSMF